MAKAVDALPSWTARHEGFPWLNALGAMKARGELTQDEIVALMQRRWGTFFSPTDFTVDSDQRFYNLLHEVHRVFPKAKFLLVIRPLSKFGASAAAMGWYTEDDRHDHRWSHYRPHTPINRPTISRHPSTSPAPCVVLATCQRGDSGLLRESQSRPNLRGVAWSHRV